MLGRILHHSPLCAYSCIAMLVITERRRRMNESLLGNELGTLCGLFTYVGNGLSMKDMAKLSGTRLKYVGNGLDMCETA